MTARISNIDYLILKQYTGTDSSVQCIFSSHINNSILTHSENVIPKSQLTGWHIPTVWWTNKFTAKRVTMQYQHCTQRKSCSLACHCSSTLIHVTNIIISSVTTSLSALSSQTKVDNEWTLHKQLWQKLKTIHTIQNQWATIETWPSNCRQTATINKKAQLSLTNPRDACEKFVRFT